MNPELLIVEYITEFNFSESVFLIVLAAISYTVYELLFQLGWIVQKQQSPAEYYDGNFMGIDTFKQRITGAILLGITPAVIIFIILNPPLKNVGLNLTFEISNLYWLAGLLTVVWIVLKTQEGKEENFEEYPHVRIKKWDKTLIFWNGLTWIIFLISYEFFFRGVLLYATIPLMGVVWAIVFNAVVYAGVHIKKGWKEAVGSIPFGAVLCIVTINTGSVWVAVLVHIFLAVYNDYISIRANPEMKFTTAVFNSGKV